MSNATQHSRQPGDNKRRRSRGGKNRNTNQQDKRRGGDRGERGSRGQRGSQSNRSEEFRPQGPRPPRGSRPVKLTWWQKLLQAVGLYKAPAPPARRERKEDDAKPKREPRPPKSNTRNARSNDGDAAGTTDERPPKRGGRSGRGSRDGERPRGGDPSTVESPRVYVGNLSYDVSEQDLQELFKGVGSVRNVEIVYNRSTHRSKGYGFVEMLHKDDAIRCVEVLNDQPFMGRNLTVSGAKSKGQDEREDEEGRTESAPVQVVLAPLPEFPEEPAAEAVAEVQAEPEIQTIVENVAETPAAEAPVEEAPVSEEAAADLVAKYGFEEEPEKKAEDA
jgi:hypothetical protein